jgi:hypothetical protein
MSQSRQFFRRKPTDGISCVPVSIVFAAERLFRGGQTSITDIKALPDVRLIVFVV